MDMLCCTVQCNPKAPGRIQGNRWWRWFVVGWLGKIFPPGSPNPFDYTASLKRGCTHHNQPELCSTVVHAFISIRCVWPKGWRRTQRQRERGRSKVIRKAAVRSIGGKKVIFVSGRAKDAIRLHTAISVCTRSRESSHPALHPLYVTILCSKCAGNSHHMPNPPSRPPPRANGARPSERLRRRSSWACYWLSVGDPHHTALDSNYSHGSLSRKRRSVNSETQNPLGTTAVIS